MAELSIAEYAKRHGISEQRVRALASQERINARKIGSRWVVTDAGSQRIARGAGRSPLPETVWASAYALEEGTLAIDTLKGVPERRRAAKRFLERLAHQSGDDRARLVATWAANRGELHYVRAADAAEVADDPRVAKSGLAWSHSPVQAAEDIDVYVRADHWESLRADHALVEVPQPRANARVRVVAADANLAGDVPALIAIADLLDISSPRARVAASSLAASLLSSPVAGMVSAE